MTLQPQGAWKIPSETIRVAQAALGKENVYMTIYEQLGQVYQDRDFLELYPVRCGKLAFSPAKLALITLMQFAEGLSDRQAALAVRSRIDWKYILGLELTHKGIDHSVLSEFRTRLIESGEEEKLLEVMLNQLQKTSLIKKRGKQRTDATHVLGAIRRINRLENVGETLRKTLNDLATVAPDWLKDTVEPEWYERYGNRLEAYRLPQKKGQREQLAIRIGFDGHQLLEAIWKETGALWLRKIESVEVLRQVWIQQYVVIEGQLVWRSPQETGMPKHNQLIVSPYDQEARNASKRQTNWTGYKVHLTESCDQKLPHLITNVETTSATTNDVEMTSTIHQSLSQKQLLPQEHLLDSGYIDAENIVTSANEHQVELVGRVLGDNSWQKKSDEGFDLSCFEIDWQQQQAICPLGQTSRSWRCLQDDSDNQVVEVRFHQSVCAVCEQRGCCTKSAKAPRVLKLRPMAQHQALQTARTKQTTVDFQAQYAPRAGIEGTISQGVRVNDLRRSRYIGLAKTHLQHLATAAAINLSRLSNWFQGIPLAPTRTSRFAALETSI